MFSQVEPRKNLFLDWLTVSCMILFIFINFGSAFFFIKLKRSGRILSSVRYVYLILSIVSSVLHVVSIFMTYGFFWPDINNAITSHTCSLWSFWFQWFCGFSIWISILFLRIFTIAQTTVTQIRSESPAVRIVQRCFVVLTLMGIILVIGILGEAFSSFYHRESGQCTTSMFIKMSILIWLIFVIVTLMVLSYIIKKKSMIQDNAHLLNIEIKIVRFAWPILFVDILLNFSGLTIYPLIRFIFILLIILMYLWSTIILYFNQVIAYYFGHNPYVGAFLDYYEINSEVKYQRVLNQSEHSDPAIRESFDEEDHFYTVAVREEPPPDRIRTPADSLLGESSQPQVFECFGGSLTQFNQNDLESKSKLMKMILGNDQLFGFFCNFVRGYCLKLKEESDLDKNISFEYFRADISQMADIEVSVIYFIDFILKMNDASNRYKMGHQLDDTQFIQLITIVFNEFIDSAIGKPKDISEKDLAGSSHSRRPLHQLSQHPEIAPIITSINNDFYLGQDNFRKEILANIRDLLSNFKKKLVDSCYVFYSELNGINEMIADQKERQKSNTLILQEFDEIF